MTRGFFLAALLSALMVGAWGRAQEKGGDNYYISQSLDSGLYIAHRLWNISETSRIVAVNNDWSEQYFYDRNTGGVRTEQTRENDP